MWFSLILSLFSSAAGAGTYTCERMFEEKGPSFEIQLGARVAGTSSAPESNRDRYLRIGHYSLREFDTGNVGYGGRTETLRDMILKEDLDVVSFTELLNEQSLKDIARSLRDEYVPVLIDGNDPYSSNVGVLLRRTLTAKVKVQSHRALRHVMDGVEWPIYNRDFLLLNFYFKDEPRPLAMGFNHFKAHTKQAAVRERQERRGVEILEANQVATSAIAGLLIGDVNSEVRHPEAFKHLRAARYRDALDFLGVPHDKRRTLTYFKDEEARGTQVDGIYLSSEITGREAVSSAYIVADQDRHGRKLSHPTSKLESASRVSDHQLYVVEIDRSKLRRR